MSILWCFSARCISKAWVCDGDSDCEDNSDEDNCEALVCKLSHHVCATNDSICLPPEKLCDGTDDCPDGSDEKLCGENILEKLWTQKAQHLFNVMLWFNLQFNIQNTFLDKLQPFHFISCLQTCVRWAMGVVVTTAALFPGKASCVLVRWAWSWELTTRPATSRAFAPNISSVARSVNRRNLVSSAPATRAGSWSLTWRAAKAPVSPPTSWDFCLTLLYTIRGFTPLIMFLQKAEQPAFWHIYN